MMTEIPADLLADVRSGLADCANDLMARVEAQYDSIPDSDRVRRMQDRDMAVVERARAVLRRLDEAVR